MSPEALKVFLSRCVRVVDREGGVWWTYPENVPHFETLERTHVKEFKGERTLKGKP